MNAIEINGICKQYQNFTLNQVSFSVPMGSIVGFVGENGAGKSTTIKAIMNLIHTEAGEIKILGQDSKSRSVELNEEIGVVFGKCYFHDNLTIKKIKKILAGVYRQWQPEIFERYVREFNLPEDKIIKEFSRGMQMKLSIAAALSHNAKILVLDEATSGLDPVIRDKILDLFLDFMQDEEHSILVSSHIISDLEKVADYIVCIHKGKILFDKSKDDLLEECGIVRCGSAEFEKLDQAHVLGFRKSQFGYEALVDNRPQLTRNAKGVQVDPATIEEIILFQTKEERL